MRESLARGGARAKEERGIRQRRERSEDARMTSPRTYTSRLGRREIGVESTPISLLGIRKFPVHDKNYSRARVGFLRLFFPTNNSRQGSRVVFLGRTASSAQRPLLSGRTPTNDRS